MGVKTNLSFKTQDVTVFAQAIGGSPLADKLEPDDSATDADVIVAFEDIP